MKNGFIHWSDRTVAGKSGALTVALAFLAATGTAAESLQRASGIDSPYWHSVSITEVMAEPSKVDAVSGQWIEIQNLTDSTVNVQGMVLMSTTSDGFHVISPSAERLIEPGRILVMGSRTEPALNGGAKVDYSYGSDLLLGQLSDVVLLMRDGKLVDYMSYGSTGIQVEKGYSISREPAPEDVADAAWCPARQPFGLGDFGTPGYANTYCDNDLDTYSEDEGDCDDTNPAVKPGASEACNGLDDNCNGDTDESVTPPSGTCPSEGVCSAIVPSCRGTSGFVCPEVEGWEPDGETLCDRKDNDCDGRTDEGLTFNGTGMGGACIGAGQCGPGTVVCSPQTAKPTCSSLPDGTAPGSSAETCDGNDNDCDGFTDEGFHIGESCVAGKGICRSEGVIVCNGASESGCDAVPGKASVELCGDRLDNDCDGTTDEGFPVGDPCSAGNGSCRSVSKYVCSTDQTGVVCPAIPSDPKTEICLDQEDNDCDGTTDEPDCERRASGCGATGGSPFAWPFLLTLAAVLTGLSAVRSRKPRNSADNG